MWCAFKVKRGPLSLVTFFYGSKFEVKQLTCHFRGLSECTPAARCSQKHHHCGFPTGWAYFSCFVIYIHCFHLTQQIQLITFYHNPAHQTCGLWEKYKTTAHLRPRKEGARYSLLLSARWPYLGNQKQCSLVDTPQKGWLSRKQSKAERVNTELRRENRQYPTHRSVYEEFSNNLTEFQ